MNVRTAVVVVLVCGACQGGGVTPDASAPDAAGDGTVTADTGVDSATDAPSCINSCSADGRTVVDCHGNVVSTCTASDACDPTTLVCVPACQAAADAKGSVGCEFFATNMEGYYSDQCFAAYVVNTSLTNAHINVEFYASTPLPVATFTRIPSGIGGSTSYGTYDATAGLAPSQAAVLFLGGSSTSSPPCPIANGAIPLGTQLQNTGKGRAFHITTDVPVASFEMNPFGGGVAFDPSIRSC